MRNVLIFIPFSLCAAATLLLATPALLTAGDNSNSGGMIALIVTTIVGFLTMIAQQIFATQKATREHNWEVEARRELVKKTSDEARILRDVITDKVDERANTHAVTLEHSIEVASHAASDDASRTNTRLIELQEQNQELLRRMEQLEKLRAKNAAER